MNVGAVNNQAVSTIQSEPQLKQDSATVNSTSATTEVDQATQEAIANLMSMSVVTSMIQGSAMTKNAISKGNQDQKELMAEIAKEEEDREAEEGIPAY